MADEEKGSGINPPELTDIVRGIQDILEKCREVQNEDNHTIDKSKGEGMRRKSLQTFSETRDQVEDEEGSSRYIFKRSLNGMQGHYIHGVVSCIDQKKSFLICSRAQNLPTPVLVFSSLACSIKD